VNNHNPNTGGDLYGLLDFILRRLWWWWNARCSIRIGSFRPAGYHPARRDDLLKGHFVGPTMLLTHGGFFA
jgi:hypothetical protein